MPTAPGAGIAAINAGDVQTVEAENRQPDLLLPIKLKTQTGALRPLYNKRRPATVTTAGVGVGFRPFLPTCPTGEGPPANRAVPLPPPPSTGRASGRAQGGGQ